LLIKRFLLQILQVLHILPILHVLPVLHLLHRFIKIVDIQGNNGIYTRNLALALGILVTVRQECFCKTSYEYPLNAGTV